MKPTVYIETTVISYLTARASRDIVMAAQQLQTREWWDQRRGEFDLFTSELVIKEIRRGDATAAAERVKVAALIQSLKVTPAATQLAHTLIGSLKLPPRAHADALHVGIAATNGIGYLLTWNCRHLANAVLRPRIEVACRGTSVEPPVICTPFELMEDVP